MDEDEIQRWVRQHLREEGFRPEFINRIDEIIVFHHITREQMKDIVTIQINRLGQRLAERHITLQLTDAVRDLLAEMGYDPQFGAHLLKGVIQREVENPIAHGILNGIVRELVYIGEVVVTSALLIRSGSRSRFKLWKVGYSSLCLFFVFVIA